MNNTQRIRLALLLTNIKLGGRFSFRTFTFDKDYPKDPDPENWRTINGSHVHLSNGKIDGGAGGKFKANAWVGKKSHGHNSFFPLHEMSYKAGKPYKAASVSAQAGSAGASEAKTIAQLASKSKAASIGEAAQTSAIASMAEYMKKKKAEAAAPAAPPPAPPAPEPEEEAVPFGSPDPVPEPTPGVYEEDPPLYLVKYMKGTFKGLHAGHQQEIKNLISEIKKTGQIPDNAKDGFLPEQQNLVLNTVAALKAKKLPPTAAQNIIAAAATKPGSYTLKMLNKQWGGKEPPDMATVKAPAKPKASAAGASAKMSDPAKWKNMKKDITPTVGDEYFNLTPGEKAEMKDLLKVYHDNGTAMFEDAMKDFYGIDPSSNEGCLLKAAVHQKEQGKIGPLELYDVCAAVINKADGVGDLINKVAPLTPKEKTAVYKAELQKLASKPMQTPGLSSVDTSAAATGINQAPGTLGLFHSNSSGTVVDQHWTNFEEYNKVQYDHLASTEKSAIHRYTKGSTHLRDYLVYGKVEGWGEYTKEALQKKVDGISKGLKKMKHPPMWVNRGASLMDWATADNPGGVTVEQLKKMAKSGETFTNQAFLSTNPTDKITYGDTDVIRRFYVPEKASGGYIDSGSAYPGEKEFLLDKNTKTRIMKVEESNGTIITYEEVIL